MNLLEKLHQQYKELRKANQLLKFKLNLKNKEVRELIKLNKIKHNNFYTDYQQLIILSEPILEDELMCKICFKFLPFKKVKKVQHCSKECRSKDKEYWKEIREKRIKTNLQLYGVEEGIFTQKAKQNHKKSCIQKFGVENPFKSKQYQQQLKQKCVQKYGVDNIFKTQQFKQKLKKQNLQKYGVEYYILSEEAKQKRIETNIQKYGVDNPFKSAQFKQKLKESNLQKYGVQYIVQTEEHKKKTKQTCLQKYGVEYSTQSNQMKEKTKQTNKEKYGFEYKKMREGWDTILSWKQYIIPLFDKTEYKGFKNQIYKWKCAICGNEFQSKIKRSGNFLEEKNQNKNFDLIPRCLKCFPLVTGYSYQQIQLANFCKQYFNIIQNDHKLIKPYQIDIVIPKIKLAIEYNGNFWHSQECPLSIRRDPNYHINKCKLAWQKGYRLIHIWEDEWENDKEEIKNKLVKIFEGKEDLNQLLIEYNNKIPLDLYFNYSNNNYFNIEDPQLIKRDKFECYNCGYLTNKNL